MKYLRVSQGLVPNRAVAQSIKGLCATVEMGFFSPQRHLYLSRCHPNVHR